MPKHVATCEKYTSAYEKFAGNNRFINLVAARNADVTDDKSLQPTVSYIEGEI
jgi:hypothetical protein